MAMGQDWDKFDVPRPCSRSSVWLIFYTRSRPRSGSGILALSLSLVQNSIKNYNKFDWIIIPECA